MKRVHKYIIRFLSFVLILSFMVLSLQALQQKTSENEKESLEKAMRRGIMECYALEGHYPSDLNDLIDHYHIIYNKDKYDIHYEIIASNILPNITIIEKE